MQDFSCAAALLVVERGVVDQEVGAPDQRGDPGLILDGPRISGVDDLPPRARSLSWSSNVASWIRRSASRTIAATPGWSWMGRVSPV